VREHFGRRLSTAIPGGTRLYVREIDLAPFGNLSDFFVGQAFPQGFPSVTA